MKLTLTPTAIAAALLLSALALPAQLQAQTADLPDTAAAPQGRYAQDLRDVMAGARMVTILQSQPINWSTMSAPDREFDTAFRRQTTEEEAYRRLMPAFAAGITPRQAGDLARMMRSPAWRKREQKLASLNGGSIYLSTFMSPAEIAETRRIDATPAMADYLATRKRRQELIQEAMNRWALQFNGELDVKISDALRKVKSDLAAARESRTGATITIGRVGVGYADKLVWIAGDSLIKMDNAYNRFEDALTGLGFSDIMKPEYLASKVSLAHSRTVVDQAEGALEVLLKDVDQTIKEREEALRKITYPSQAAMLRHIEKGTSEAYTYMVTFGEGYRHLLDDQRRVLAFVAERDRKLKYEDGKLLFASAKDLAMANELFDKLEATRLELNALIDGQIKKEEEAERHRRAGRTEQS